MFYIYNTDCVDTVGSYKCVCHENYIGTGDKFNGGTKCESTEGQKRWIFASFLKLFFKVVMAYNVRNTLNVIWVNVVVQVDMWKTQVRY